MFNHQTILIACSIIQAERSFSRSLSGFLPNSLLLDRADTISTINRMRSLKRVTRTSINRHLDSSYLILDRELMLTALEKLDQFKPEWLILSGVNYPQLLNRLTNHMRISGDATHLIELRHEADKEQPLFTSTPEHINKHVVTFRSYQDLNFLSLKLKILIGESSEREAEAV